MCCCWESSEGDIKWIDVHSLTTIELHIVRCVTLHVNLVMVTLRIVKQESQSMEKTKMETETREKITRWFVNDLLGGHEFDETGPQSQENICNLLAGFLQACEIFGLVTHDEAQELFTEFVG